MNERTSWSTPREAVAVWFAKDTLRKTMKIALIVGVILCSINIGLKLPISARVVLNFVVPFCVSSIGVLSATRRRTEGGRRSP